MTTVQRYIDFIVVAVNIIANITHHTTSTYADAKDINFIIELCNVAIKNELYGILLLLYYIVKPHVLLFGTLSENLRK